MACDDLPVAMFVFERKQQIYKYIKIIFFSVIYQVIVLRGGRSLCETKLNKKLFQDISVISPLTGPYSREAMMQ